MSIATEIYDGDEGLYIGVADIVYYSKVYNGDKTIYGYFAGRISTTAIDYSSSIPDWTPQGTGADDGYNYGDKVKIEELRSVFIAKVNKLKTHPLVDGRGWWQEGSNAYASLDQMESSESIHPKDEDAVEVFNGAGVTHIVGLNIKGASMLIVERRIKKDNGLFGEWECVLIKELVNHTCYQGCCTCCSDGYFLGDRYLANINFDRCSVDNELRVTLKRDLKHEHVSIGTQTTICSRHLGCVVSAEWGDDTPESYKMWDGKGLVTKDILFIKRSLDVEVGVYEAKSKDDSLFLSSHMKRKHFFWVTKKDKLDDANLYENSLIFGNLKKLKGSYSEYDINKVPYSIRGIET